MLIKPTDASAQRRVLGQQYNAHDPELTFPAEAVRRTMAEFGYEITEEELHEEAQAWATAVDDARARGPLELAFPTETRVGLLHYRDLSTGAEEGVPAQGQITVSDLVEVNELELAHPSEELIAALPLSQVQHVRILGCTPAATAALAEHTGLRRLDLVAVIEDNSEPDDFDGLTAAPGGDPITAADLEHLGRLSELTELAIDGMTADDDAVAQLLARLPKLRQLSLTSDTLTGRCLAGLADHEVEVVVLEGGQVSGQALSSLPTLAGLYGAVFVGPSVGDGLDPAAVLAALPGLAWLQLHLDDETPLDPTVTARFTALRPHLEVNVGDQADEGWGGSRGLAPIRPAGTS